ncbi:MAG TPA: DUF6351 family protein [Kofleriaceae bacterium]|nr:DUF6351 family protein [Kofleriaceae bacterium]
MGKKGFLVTALALIAGAACTNNPGDGPPGPPPGDGRPGRAIEIRTLSNRADMISGGDALVEIVVPDRRSFASLRVSAGTRDVTSAFAMRPSGRMIGLIDHLAEGKNLITADVGDGETVALTITNHKIGGPVFSGPQVTPFVCATPLAQPASGSTPASQASGLSTLAIDDQCNIATEVKLYYRTTAANCSLARPDPNPPATAPANACFRPYTPGAAPPADLAMTTTDTGVTVPYIVRVERGTLNRGIYDLAVLFDPSKDNVVTGWKPTAPQPQWNGKVVYSFGASSGQPRQQFRSEQNWNDDAALSRGFLVAINSQTDSLYNANRVSMAETVMMMKEKIIDTYGEVRYVLGNGCSGGSINQITLSSIFPGLVDGIQPTCTYPDSESTAIEVSDCALLVNFYASPAWRALTAGMNQAQINAKKAAINGHADQTGCHAWVNTFSNLGRPGNYVPMGVIDNVTGAVGPIGAMTNNCGLPAALVYDPVKNPTGTRCTGTDHDVSLLGTVPGTTRARQLNDNVGVQYGLKALQAGAITAEEFVTINEKIGGVDFDQNFVAQRSVADLEALLTVYRAGIISDGKQLAKTPIIDVRGFDDSNLAPPVGALGIHHIWRSFSLRARLDAATGTHNNHVLWRFGTGLIAPAASGLTLQSFLLMDQWVSAIKADTSDTAIERKVARYKPPEAFDFCYLTSDTTFSKKVTDPALCDGDRFLKPHSSPRQVAGGPVAENILKCQLRPLDRRDYPASLTDAQFARLAAAFPRGVCDFSKPGVGEESAVSPLDFSGGPGGAVLPPAPKSAPDRAAK